MEVKKHWNFFLKLSENLGPTSIKFTNACMKYFLIVVTLFEQLNFEKPLVANLKSYCEQQQRLKDIVIEAEKLVNLVKWYVYGIKSMCTCTVYSNSVTISISK